MLQSICLLLFAFCLQSSLGVDLNVKTSYGNITGIVSTSGLYKVWNTRYAASPAGTNRWKAPKPLTPWNGTVDASQNPPMCPQPGSFAQLQTISEDCLFLSVYVPVNHTLSNSLLPVQVFIHGGTFVSGGALIYNGEVLAGNDMVFVSINYRLGALGFLAHPALYTSENGAGVGFYGIQDQRAALQWVQANIGAFGGDKDRVTVSGESAGAISICAHFAMPSFKGLFHQAIMESGLCNGFWTNSTALTYGQTAAQAVGCTTGDILSCLYAANATLLNAAASTVFPSLSSSELTVQPIQIIQAGSGFRVPLLIGTNKNEYSLFACPSYSALDAAQYPALVSSTFPPGSSLGLPLYPLSSYSTPVQAFIDIGSDFLFKCPTKALSDYFSFFSSSSVSSPVFMYSFNNQPSYFQLPSVTLLFLGSADAKCFGASHSFELPYLFNLYDAYLTLNPTELALRATMRNAWVAFVVNGVPSLPSLSWPRYDNSTAQYVNLDTGSFTIGSQFRVPFCSFWNFNSTSFPSSTTSATSSNLTSSSSTFSTSSTTSSSSFSTTSGSSKILIPFCILAGILLLII